MRKSLILMTLPIVTACTATTSTPPVTATEAPPASAETATRAPTASYPETRRQELVEPQFGVQVADPYRWLENDVRNDPEVRAWVTAQNQVTDAFLETLPLRDKFKARMTELYDYERF